jgi:RES domain-containing protein
LGGTEDVLWHPEAIADAEHALAWYRERREIAAHGFAIALEWALQAICDAPHRWLALDVPDARVEHLEADPFEPAALTRAVGDRLLGSDGVLAFTVPTATASVDRLAVLNPEHPDWSSAVRAADPEPFDFDPRIELALRRHVRAPGGA